MLPAITQRHRVGVEIVTAVVLMDGSGVCLLAALQELDVAVLLFGIGGWRRAVQGRYGGKIKSIGTLGQKQEDQSRLGGPNPAGRIWIVYLGLLWSRGSLGRV